MVGWLCRCWSEDTAPDRVRQSTPVSELADCAGFWRIDSKLLKFMSDEIHQNVLS